jgi:AcrR family transcriptional regulator
MYKLKNVDQNKLDIMNAARELFQKFGIKKTTMDEIASGAKKSKTTIYQYFDNKEDIFFEVIKEETRMMFDKLNLEINKQKNSSDELKTYIKLSISEVKERILLFALLRGEIKLSALEPSKMKNEIDQFEKELVKNIIINGINANEFSKKHKKSAEHIALYIINFVRGLIFQIIFHDEMNKHISNDNQLDHFIDILISGLRSNL